MQLHFMYFLWNGDILIANRLLRSHLGSSTVAWALRLALAASAAFDFGFRSGRRKFLHVRT